MSGECIVALTCCGHDDGTYAGKSWEDADAFRESYLDAGGHDRSAIIAFVAAPLLSQEEEEG